MCFLSMFAQLFVYVCVLCMYCCLVTKSCRTFAIPWTIACQVPLSMGFSRQFSRIELPFSSPGDHPRPAIKLKSLALAGRVFTTEPPWKPLCVYTYVKIHRTGHAHTHANVLILLYDNFFKSVKTN